MAHQHSTSPLTYWIIFAALLVLTVVTVLVADMALGRWDVLVAMSIAATKATLVVLYFMHALHSPKLTWAVIVSAIFFLLIMIGLTLSDYLTRG